MVLSGMSQFLIIVSIFSWVRTLRSFTVIRNHLPLLSDRSHAWRIYLLVVERFIHTRYRIRCYVLVWLLSCGGTHCAVLIVFVDFLVSYLDDFVWYEVDTQNRGFWTSTRYVRQYNLEMRYLIWVILDFLCGCSNSFCPRSKYNVSESSAILIEYLCSIYLWILVSVILLLLIIASPSKDCFTLWLNI